jgi:hypothetical protein
MNWILVAFKKKSFKNDLYRIYLNNLVPSQTSIFARLHSIESIDRYRVNIQISNAMSQ